MQGNLLSGRNLQCIGSCAVTTCGLTFLPHTTTSSPPRCCILIYTTRPQPLHRTPVIYCLFHLSIPEAFLGVMVCALLFMPIFLGLSALFLLGFPGHLVNRACHFQSPALFFLLFLLLFRIRASCLNRYTNRELSPQAPPPMWRMMYGDLLKYRFLDCIDEHACCVQIMGPLE